MIRRLFIALSLIILSTAFSFAQKPKAVSWSASVVMTSPTKGNIIIAADITPGWHLYGTNIPEGGPQATSFKLVPSDGISVGKKLVPSVKPLKVKDEMFGMDLTWWDKPVRFTVPVTIAKPGAVGTVDITISNMACNDMNCMPPATTKLSVKVAAPAKK